MQLRSSPRTHWFLAAIGLSCAMFCTGCQDTMQQVRGDGFKDEFSGWGEKQRPAGEQGEMSGFSTKSQQIERNLGVR